MTETRTPLGGIPAPSTDFSWVTLEDALGRLLLRYEYGDEGRALVGGIRFERVRAYRQRAESHCTEWHIEDAYDTLVEIEGSEWVAELLDAMPSDMRDLFEMHHYMIYLDSVGCYEVVAASWRFLAEARAEPE